MPDNSSSTRRITFNTSLLYVRMMVVMIINLYAVRLVLNALGAQDYGINNVVTGIITMLGSISSVLSTATQRYYSYSIGEDKLERLRNIFSASINIFGFLSLIVLILGETAGLWFVNTQLVLPSERMNAANWIYQLSIFSFIFSFLQVPYFAATMAHEDMGIFAIISTAESILRLVSVFFIYIIPIDGLIIYGTIQFLISALVLISYIVISRKKYDECCYHKPTEKDLYKELLSFSGWSLFGSIAGVGMAQVNTILVNIFFGPLVNAARAISFQFSMAVSSFSNSFLMAIRTPMIKSYAEESYVYLNKIFNMSNKFIYYSLLMVCLPIIFEMDIILIFWLKTSDAQTVFFSRLILVYALIMSLNNPISIIIQATGHVKGYHVAVEIFTLSCVPATYILFKLGYPAASTYIVMIIAAIASHIVRLICLKKYYKAFSYSEYIKSFLLPAFAITIILSSFLFLIHRSIVTASSRALAVFLFSIVCVPAVAFLIGLTKSEKGVLKQLIAYTK
jgi:O-antigen/teichoic acid export membrane protein